MWYIERELPELGFVTKRMQKAAALQVVARGRRVMACGFATW